MTATPSIPPASTAAPAGPSRGAAPSNLHFSRHVCRGMPAGAETSLFLGANGVDELNLIVRPTAHADVKTQLAWIESAYHEALVRNGFSVQSALVRRWFCSDLANQSGALALCAASSRDAPDVPCAVSWLGIPPAPPAKFVLWAYHVRDPAAPLCKARDPATLTWSHGGLEHLWTTGITAPPARGPQDQTRATLARYDDLLRARGLTWNSDVLRTWLFVRNIDTDYGEVVTARRDFYASRGLTPETHFIASTGIGGGGSDIAALLTFDAYAVRGLRPEQVSYLSAPEHLGPTHLYGVTFERGVSVTYRDRRHVLISGTASIDPQGRIVHPGDVSRQTERALDNIAALLATAGATLSDMGALIAYVRDLADLPLVANRVRARCPDSPVAVFLTPICRPGWLVEIEGTAMIPCHQPALPSY